MGVLAMEWDGVGSAARRSSVQFHAVLRNSMQFRSVTCSCMLSRALPVPHELPNPAPGCPHCSVRLSGAPRCSPSVAGFGRREWGSSARISIGAGGARIAGIRERLRMGGSEHAMECEGVGVAGPRRSVPFHVVACSSMQFHVVPCSSMRPMRSHAASALHSCPRHVPQCPVLLSGAPCRSPRRGWIRRFG
jgi:hypothetical protein